MAFDNLPSIEDLDNARRPLRLPEDRSHEMLETVRREQLRKLARLKVQRKYEGINLYQPLPLAEEFHAANIPFRIAGGSNRCLGGSQTIYDPITKLSRRVDEIGDSFHVISIDPISGKAIVAEATRPFIKGTGDIYRFTLSTGATIDATMEHRVVSSSGAWVSLEEALVGEISLFLQSSRFREAELRRREGRDEPRRLNIRNARQSRKKKEVHLRTCGEHHPQEGTIGGFSLRPQPSCVYRRQLAVSACRTSEGGCGLFDLPLAEGSLSGCLSDTHLYDERPPYQLGICRDDFPSQGGAAEHKGTFSYYSGRLDGSGQTAKHSPCTSSRHHSNMDLDGLNTGLAAASESHNHEACCGSSRRDSHTSFQSLLCSTARHNTSSEGRPLVCEFDASSHPSRFNLLINSKQCVIVSAEKIADNGEIWDITVEPYANYVCGGLINANSSKTLSCSWEAACVFCGCDPHDKYRKENGQAWVVGLEADQLTIIYRKLFQPGAFKIIQGEDGKWRSVRPDPNDPSVLDPYDLAYCEKWVDAPPLIPQRMIRTLAWEDRAKDQPRLITFVNGWRSLWRSSKGDPPQGDEVHFAWFDEEMLNLHFFYEAVRGMTYMGGNPRYIPKMVWSATAQVGNVEFSGLCDRAENGDQSVRLFDYLVEDNPYVSPEEKKKFFDALPAGERETRYYGIRADKRRRCYPMWDPMTNWEHGGHGIEPIDISPAKYCRWVYIDPGISPAEVLFVAVDEDNSRKIVYDGFQLDGATGSRVAQAIKDRERGMQFEGFVIDSVMGRQHTMTQHETTVVQEYKKSFDAVGLKPRQEGPMDGFFPSCQDVEARTRSLWRMLEPRQTGPYTGTPEVCVMRGVIPELEIQVKAAQTDPKNPKKRLKLTTNNRAKHNGFQRGSGLLDGLEYMAAHDPQYFAPEKVNNPEEMTAWDHFQERQRINKQAAKARRRLERSRVYS